MIESIHIVQISGVPFFTGTQLFRQCIFVPTTKCFHCYDILFVNVMNLFVALTKLFVYVSSLSLLDWVRVKKLFHSLSKLAWQCSICYLVITINTNFCCDREHNTAIILLKIGRTTTILQALNLFRPGVFYNRCIINFPAELPPILYGRYHIKLFSSYIKMYRILRNTT